MLNQPSYYIYLISSLPMLHFGMRPPFSFERFLEICQGALSERDLARLKTPALKKWQDFDTALRNELVKIRAARKRVDAAKYLRLGGYQDPALSRLAINAQRNPSILEAEEALDRARWSMLDELSLGHYFDLEALISYAIKLLMLERWERIRAQDKPRVLEDVLQGSQANGSETYRPNYQD